LPFRSPNWAGWTSQIPIAPDTTTKLKIVFAKSYVAQASGTIARPLGVSPASPPRRRVAGTIGRPDAVTRR